MLFNSNAFLQFLAAFLLLFHLCRRHLVARNALVLLASYVFYGWWDARFLVLLFLTSLLDFVAARRIETAVGPRGRKFWLSVSLAGNLGVLGVFKYFNFFVDSFVEVLAAVGLPADPRTLNIVLPVGISFYTFQSMSYSLDVYRGRLAATRNLLNFLAYVAFFPQLVAGPIERASHLLPQFESTRSITRTHLRDGLWLVLWGLFKKVVVADNLAPMVELVYQHPTDSGPAVVLGTLAFAFQIYGDFSGYSDIARGLAKWLGFDLMVNFNLPYFATSPREFWRRWHISLSTWLRDYLYISLGGNRRGLWRTRLNLLLTMVLGGLWHGAAWHFVLWGGWHGIGLVLTRKADLAARPSDGLPASTLPAAPGRWRRVVSWGATSLFVLYGWLLFRAGSWEQVAAMTGALANWHWPAWTPDYMQGLLAFVGPLLLVQWWQARSGDLLAPARAPAWVRGALQAVLVLLIVTFWKRQASPFIYFQF
ncbi:MAG: MBOAT family protein [Verrucomicrobiales bacterium]|nr:MBOAT family protein [Verrucomicrobiales bacterium]